MPLTECKLQSQRDGPGATWPFLIPSHAQTSPWPHWSFGRAREEGEIWRVVEELARLEEAGREGSGCSSWGGAGSFVWAWGPRQGPHESPMPWSLSPSQLDQGICLACKTSDGSGGRGSPYLCPEQMAYLSISPTGDTFGRSRDPPSVPSCRKACPRPWILEP